MVLSLRNALATLLLASALPGAAQVSFGGRPLALLEHAPALPAPSDVRLPAVDADALLAEDAARAAAGIKGPYRFGYNHSVDLGTAVSGTWHTLRNGDRVWRQAITCPGAFSINFRFDVYEVPEGARVFVYNDQGTTFGAFTAASAPGRTSMGVSQMPGSRITIEYHEPARAAFSGRLHVDRVTHAYRDVFRYAKDLGDSGPCNINVICPEGDEWRDQIRSVAIITTGGSGFCTGTLLNNCEQDSTPYFLTANHCLSPDVADWVFRFNWDSPTCDPTEDGPIDQTVAGCTQLVNNPGTDMLFLELSSIPPADYNVFYSGWDKSGTTPDSVCGIHHPSGDIKKISLSQSPILQDNIDVGNGPADCWQVTQWDAGTTEPGSSGSALFDQNKLVIGQLYGGQADCSNSVNDYYGRLDISWPFIEEWLGTCGDSLLGLGDGLPEPVHFDAAVTSIVDIPELLCGVGEIAPGITLKNNGDVILTTIVVDYGIQGGPPYVYNWFGSLQPGQTVNVTLPAIPVLFTTMPQVLDVTCSFPNGNVDEEVLNDSWSYTFSVSNPGAEITLLLTLDNFGSDVTWTLAAEGGSDLYSGGPYPDFEEGLVDTVRWCLSNGCYVFTIQDVFGNGLCCDDGEGSYVIIDADSTVLAESDGQYEEENQNIFCPDVVGIQDRDTERGVEVHPNPVSDMLTVRFVGFTRVDRLLLLDATGRTVFATAPNGAARSTIDTGSLAAGVYTLLADERGERVVQRVVVQH